LALSCAVGLAACGPSDSPLGIVPPQQSCVLVGPRVSPGSATLHPGDTLRASAAPAACTSTNVHFRWISSDTTIASVTADAGLIRALKPGTVTVSAIVVEDPSQKGAIVILVNP
jgi:uncharacterized protein YjdB